MCADDVCNVCGRNDIYIYIYICILLWIVLLVY